MALAAGPATPPEQQLTPLPTAPVTVVPAADPTTTPSSTTSDTLPTATPAVDDSQLATPQQVAAQQISPQQIECVAKVIRHEAANQPVDGQVAVAQVIRARMNDGRFPRTACGVVRQRGQFFDVDAYDPPRNDARWALAMRVATQVMTGNSDDVANGALFFHSAGVGMPGRVRVMKIADHTFYR